jgi:putative tricarboxylic transport membrane protein
LLCVRPLALITLLDSQILVPVVICVALCGSYAIDSQIENVVLTAAFGVLGYLMIRFDYPRLTVVIALVLGSTAERSFQQSLMMSDGSLMIFLSRTISIILLALIVGLLLLPLLRALLRYVRPEPAARKT